MEALPAVRYTLRKFIDFSHPEEHQCSKKASPNPEKNRSQASFKNQSPLKNSEISDFETKETIKQ